MSEAQHTPADTADRPLLTVSDLTLSYGHLRAVDGVSFSVRRGEVVSLVGPNGSGKTSTVNLISGALAPDSGRVEFDGREIQGLPAHRVARAGIARTFQNGRVFGNLSVADNVAVGLHAGRRAGRPLRSWAGVPLLGWVPLLLEAAVNVTGSGRARAEEREVAERVAEQLDRFPDRLPARADDYAYTLSYANRRRTEIARALVARPGLLLLDEPTAGMNPAETEEITRKLLELKEAGRTMLIVEHKMDLVTAVSDRVVVLDGGQVLMDGPPREIQENPRVIEAYLGRRRGTDRASGAGATEGRDV